MKLDYEVETRFRFNDKYEILEIFPQLKTLNFTKLKWNTNILSKQLFLSGKQLRISDVIVDDKTYTYLGFKKEDIGSFCNIRAEIDEQIFELKEFGKKSIILNKLLKFAQINNFNEIKTKDDFLRFYNLDKFLFFEGESEVASIELVKIIDKEKLLQIQKIKKDFKFDELNLLKLNLKIMYCSYLKYQLLFEVEMMADDKKQAFLFEKIIEKIVDSYNLYNLVVKKEPPILLFEMSNNN
jgi:hypothetical protein